MTYRVSPSNYSKSESQDDIELQVMRERLRQACQSFNLALGMVVVCAAVGLAGIGLLWSSKVSQGAVAAAGGFFSAVPCIKLAREANDRLDKMLSESQDPS